MPKEKEMYRENLVRVTEKFPNREMIPQKEVAEWLGLDIRAMSCKGFPRIKVGGRYFVSVTRLASWLS